MSVDPKEKDLRPRISINLAKFLSLLEDFSITARSVQDLVEDKCKNLIKGIIQLPSYLMAALHFGFLLKHLKTKIKSKLQEHCKFINVCFQQ